MAMTLSAILNLSGNFQAQLQSATQMASSFQKQAQAAGQSIKQAFSENVTQKFTAGLSQAKDAMGAAGIASLGFLKSSVDAAAKAEKVNADLAQTIKSTGGAAGMTADDVSKMAISLSQVTAYSAGTIKSGQNMLLTFTGIGKDVFPQASEAILDLATKMKTDTTSAAMTLGKALNDPAEGLSRLSKQGVNFSEVQEQQIKAMVAAGNTAGAQKLMIEELNKEFGGQARAALNTYDGQMQKFSQTLGGIKSAIGSVFLPYLTQIAQKLNEGAQVVSKFANEHKTLFAVILALTGVFGTLIGGAGLITKMITFIGPAVSALSGFIGGLTGPILLVIAAIGALVYAYTQNFGGLKDFIDNVVQKIVTAFSAIIKVIKDLINTGNIGEEAFKALDNAFGSENAQTLSYYLTLIRDAIVIVVDVIKGDLNGAMVMMSNNFAYADEEYRNVIFTVFSFASAIREVVMSVISTVKEHMPEIKVVITSVFQGIQSVWNSVLKPVLSFIISSIGQVVNWVIVNWPLISQTISTVMNSVINIVTSILSGIQAFWNTWGETIMDYVNVVFNNVKIYITTAIHVVEDVIKAVMQAINGDWSGAWQSVLDAVGSIFGGAIQIIQNVINGIDTIFKDVAKVAFNWGADLVNGIVDGIKSSIGYVADAAEGVANKITSFLHFSVPDEGPLTQYGQWMPDFLQGLGNGIKVNTHLVMDPIKDLSLGIKTNTLTGLSSGVAQMKSQTVSNNSSRQVTIAKLADSIVIREEADIDKFATALAIKLNQTALGMG
ncbi:phage tail protein [Clostridium saccharoperbutylacetonicum]